MFDNSPTNSPKIPTAHRPALAPGLDGSRPSGPDGARSVEDHETALELIMDYSPDIPPLSFGHVRARILAHISTIRAHTPNLDDVRGKRILDVACGSRVYPDNHLGAHDPWMPRLLLALGAIPVGLDLADQIDERFEFHKVDLLVKDSLAFLPTAAFDSYHVRAFPTKQVAIVITDAGLSWPSIRANLLEHLQRTLKPGCRPMRSFDQITDRYVRDNAHSTTPPPNHEPHSLRLDF